MRNKRRWLLGVGAGVAWVLVITISGITSIWSISHERYEWLFYALVGLASVLAVVGILVYLLDRWIPAAMQRPETKGGKHARGDDAMKKLTDAIGTVEEAFDAALHDDVPTLPPVPDDIIDACNAPAGSLPREIKCRALGIAIGRTVTPGDDPDRVWRETYQQILDAHRRNNPWRSSTAGRM